MSEYLTVKTKMREEHKHEIIKALLDLNPAWVGKIELHSVPQPLIDYYGKQKGQSAHIIVRRAWVGAASNDIGFEFLPDGSVASHVSDYDRGYDMHYDAAWQGRVAQAYAFRVAEAQAVEGGMLVEKEVREDGSWKVTLRKGAVPLAARAW
jgi:Protein of unknown function (DUF1257)